MPEIVPPEGSRALPAGRLPELHMAPLDEVVLHEDPDMERVARLVDRFSADGVLRNPPVVGRAGDGRRILLDGANRVTALRTLGYAHVMVQEIDLFDPGLTLETWHHVVEHLAADDLLAHAARIPGVTVREGGDCGPDSPGTVARLRFPDGREVRLTEGGALVDRVVKLQELTRHYHRFAYFDRVSYTSLEDLRRNYPNLTALVSFPSFTREDLQDLTRQNLRIPSGITRVCLPVRVLRFNLHLEILRAELSLEEKEAWLQQTIQQKVAEKAVRFYGEPTFLFDE